MCHRLITIFARIYLRDPRINRLGGSLSGSPSKHYENALPYDNPRFREYDWLSGIYNDKQSSYEHEIDAHDVTARLVRNIYIFIYTEMDI